MFLDYVYFEWFEIFVAEEVVGSSSSFHYLNMYLSSNKFYLLLNQTNNAHTHTSNNTELLLT